MARLWLRVELAPLGAVGPGKIRLLELIGETGSISAAGRAMDMSYRRAWLLVDGLNRLFKKPLVRSRPGGKTGGGARLTPLGETLVRRYRAMESEAHKRFAAELALFQRALVVPAKRGDRGAAAGGSRSRR